MPYIYIPMSLWFPFPEMPFAWASSNLGSASQAMAGLETGKDWENYSLTKQTK